MPETNQNVIKNGPARGSMCAKKRCRNGNQHEPKMYSDGGKMASQSEPKGDQNDAKIGPECDPTWPQNGSRVPNPKWSIRGPDFGGGLGSQVGVLWRSKRGPGGAGTGVKSKNASGSHPSRDLCELKSIFPSNLAPQTHQNTLEFYAQISFLPDSISRSRFDRF